MPQKIGGKTLKSDLQELPCLEPTEGKHANYAHTHARPTLIKILDYFVPWTACAVYTLLAFNN